MQSLYETQFEKRVRMQNRKLKDWCFMGCRKEDILWIEIDIDPTSISPDEIDKNTLPVTGVCQKCGHTYQAIFTFSHFEFGQGEPSFNRSRKAELC